MSKCTLCVDRVTVGLEPACVKACPTGCSTSARRRTLVELGAQRVAQLKGSGFHRDSLRSSGRGGTGAVTVLAHGDHPEWYGLPRDPHVPLSVLLWKNVLRPLGVVATSARSWARSAIT
jgi:predicted nucleic acid-binding Zn ribbon protein